MIFSYRLFGLLIFLFFSLSEIRAQVCTGSLGYPAFAGNYGVSPTKFGSPLLTGIEYQYIANTPGERQYTIAKDNFGMYNRPIEGGWFQIADHTEETADGYMLIINGDGNVRTISSFRHNSLCPNTTYEFSIYILNLLDHDGIDPILTFNIETPEGIVIKTATTGNIPETKDPTWQKKAILFNSGNYTDLVIRIISSNADIGDGNDFALDDYALRPCGPPIISKLDGDSKLIRNACYGDNPIITYSAEILEGFNDPEFQWEISTGGIEANNWTNYLGPGANTKSITVSYNNANIGRYIYRLLVAERGKLNSSNCKVISELYILNINKLPEVLSLTTNGSTCVGGDLQLNADIGSEVIDAYQWSGPNGFTSNLKNPVILNLTEANSGIYKVLVTNNNGCVSSSQTQILISPPIVGGISTAQATICANEPIALEAYGGTTYKWEPAEGLSDPNIANPIATLSKSTEYKVTISNGQCFLEKTILIFVKKGAVADAGSDKNVLKGKSVTLNGKVSGDDVISYYWTPVDYLDDPTKLNPVASPPEAITYTLHVESACNTSTDDVSVEVFPNIEIPNTFTPNGDGINDTWGIPAIATFPNPRLIVVNRYGKPVFESYNNTPWDGKSKGKDLPIGAYYYTLYINRDYKIYVGWVLITR